MDISMACYKLSVVSHCLLFTIASLQQQTQGQLPTGEDHHDQVTPGSQQSRMNWNLWISLLTLTTHSYGSLAWLSDYFWSWPWRLDPNRFSRKVAQTTRMCKDVPFAVKTATFHTPDLQAPRSYRIIWKIFGLDV